MLTLILILLPPIAILLIDYDATTVMFTSYAYARVDLPPRIGTSSYRAGYESYGYLITVSPNSNFIKTIEINLNKPLNFTPLARVFLKLKGCFSEIWVGEIIVRSPYRLWEQTLGRPHRSAPATHYSIAYTNTIITCDYDILILQYTTIWICM